MRTLITALKQSSLVLACAAGQLLACGSPSLVVGSLKTNSRNQGIQIGRVTGVLGAYEDGTCTDPATGAKRVGATWSIGPVQNQGTEPVVIKDDRACLLDLTAIAVQDSAGVTQQATPAAPFALPEFFFPDPILFSYTDSGTGAVMEFYVNADVTPADFSTMFSIQIMYSDTIGPVSAFQVQHTYATAKLTESLNVQVPAPQDTLDVSAMTVVLDSSNKVAMVTAEPTFTLGNPPGTGYVIVSGACPMTQAAATMAYAGGQEAPVATAPTAADFGLQQGADLSAPFERCLMIANCERLSNVCSYQMFDILFQ